MYNKNENYELVDVEENPLTSKKQLVLQRMNFHNVDMMPQY